ncbi:replication fork protection component Swi3-domain-containing protein [Mycena alexandri]|uniref:Chromosome segregation in meiosis protein n=1 Tax=Mycena alexandri TaxID=1745969 RepID=A0AAD6XG26_9AGAR|nr:replication fork protection component Swi3-domain-containing protein [Mycena alexandri]
MASIDNIWDVPVVPASPPRQPLFLAGSDDENDHMPDAPPRAPAIDLDSLFEGVEKLPDDRPPALTPHQILSSSPAHHIDDEGGEGGQDADAKKPKKKAMRLDEGRLVSASGFPQLIEDTKKIKVKGKGHEASDLNRLLQVYQFWTHRLYPKTPFKDTVDRVEKLCHTKRMHNNLSTWRDEAHGLVNGRKPDEEEDNDLTDLTDKSIPGPDSDQADYASSSTHAATRPPSSDEGDSEFNDASFDADISTMDATAKFNAQQVRQAQSTSDNDQDAAIQDVENSRTASSSGGLDDDEEAWQEAEAADAAPNSRPPAPARPEDDDDELWATVDAGVNASATSTTPVPTTHVPPPRDDEEDWNMVDEMDAEPYVPAPPPPPIEEHEDMYMDGS